MLTDYNGRKVEYAKGGKFASGGNVSYNGWTNYATWVTNLEILDGMDWKDYNMGEPISAEQVKDYVEEIMEQSPELALSFANRFLNDVNYYEIVEHINDEFDLDDGEKDEYAKGGNLPHGLPLNVIQMNIAELRNYARKTNNPKVKAYLKERENDFQTREYKKYSPDGFEYAKGGQMKKPMIRYSGRR